MPTDHPFVPDCDPLPVEVTPTDHPPVHDPRSAALSAIEQQHGRGAIFACDGEPLPVEVTPTGFPALDEALHTGGWPTGRLVEVFGRDPSLIRSLALRSIAAAQVAGRTVALVDIEHTLDTALLVKAGVSPSSLIVSQPDSGEQALDIVEALARSRAVGFIVVDSVAALVSRDELEGTYADPQVGLTARMMSKAVRKLCTVAARNDCTVLCLNHVRRTVGVTFGPSEVTAGGNALKYYSSVRVDVRRVGDEGAVQCRVVKNRLAPPFAVADIELR